MLQSVSPIDGRYADKTKELSAFFSEYALIKYRVYVEIEYFIELVELGLPQLTDFNKDLYTELREIYQHFSVEDAKAVKSIEKTTNHDVKAVEYFIKSKFDELKIEKYKEFIHFGLTSQDINNTALPLSLKAATSLVVIPNLTLIINKLEQLAQEWSEVPMLARTHGQPASPTILGKELLVYVERLTKQMVMFQTGPFSAKFGGATGNFNAHKVAFPEIDWISFGNLFVNKTLGLSRSQITTQIEHYDNLAAYFDGLKRIDTILIDLCRDMWTYISMDYFKQEIKKGEVGSSAMPHKVNPIDFENAEGNLGLSVAVCEHLAVVAEAIQTVLRSVGYPNPYEALKELTRTNEKINQVSIATFIEGLDVDASIKVRLSEITPFNYTGIFPK